MIRTILFDLDGTIIDSEPSAIQAILECTKSWSVPVSRLEAESVAGKKWEVAINLLYDRHPMPLPPEEALRQIVRRYQELVHTSVAVVPGVVESIHDFSRHFELALVSGSLRADIFWALDHLKLRPLFKCVLGAEDYPNSKPSPDGYQKAMGLLGAYPKETIVFEDSVAGIDSALAAGTRVVAIECTNHFQFDQSRAQVRIKDFTGIDGGWVRKIFP